MKQIIFKSLVVRSLAFVMLIMCTVSASAQYYMDVFRNDGQKYQFLVSSIDSVRISNEFDSNPIGPTSVVISFVANGGVGEMSPVVAFGENYILPANTFTSDGYEFTGWNTKADGSGVSYYNQQSLELFENLVLYAQWKLSQTESVRVIISFDANGGVGEMSQIVTSAENLILPVNAFTYDGYEFIGWNTNADGSGTSYSNEQSITVAENLVLYAQWKEIPTHNGYEYVDLGLSVKWATCNIGASSPEGYGSYFAWGETSPKSDYEWETYKFRTSGDYWDNVKFSKYNTDSDYGPIDNKIALDLIDDAARSNWGGSWRMPTSAEQDELREKCTWTWITLNGVKGYKVTSKSNGKSIFLPAAGSRYGTDVYNAGSYSLYWSSSLYSDNPHSAFSLYIYSDDVDWSNGTRYAGHAVRAVCLDTENIPTSYTISFNANGGEGEMSLLKIWSDETLTLPICTFTRDGNEFIGWNTKADGSGASYGNEQSITVAENLVLYAQWKEIPKTHNGYEYVDLGLSVKWATCNIGAESPEGYGDYFAWGETSPKSDYEWETYKFRTSGDSYDNVKFSKYNTDIDYGPIDTNTTLDLIDDAARTNWGGSWRMPTSAEQDELREKCTWTWTTLNGIKGYKVTSKGNGNSIFLPAAGYRGGTSVYDAGSIGFYWSSSLRSDRPYRAYYLYFNSDFVDWFNSNRYEGYPVRAVCLDTENIPTSYTISFNANGGEGEMSLLKIWSDETLTLPICTFTRDGNEFIGWNTKADGSGASYGNEQSITVAENLVLYAQWKEIPKTHNGYEYVDLGLPSGLKWATCNVGADTPEDYGDYFAWGETSPKSDYEWETYKFRTSGDYWDNVKFSKYNTDSDYGPIDNKIALDLIDDAARSNWGGSWRMPTSAEQDELREKCTWTWITLNGVKGYKVTSKSNGKSIFLPAAGSRYGTDVYNAGSYSLYWSSSLYSDNPHSAFSLYIYSDDVDWSNGTRYAGHAVRAVCLDTENIPTSYTISFNANGGEGEMSLLKIWTDETLTLPMCTFTRDGYEFIGWNTKADGTGSSYSDGQEISVKENITLYAQWRNLFEMSGTHNGYEYVDLGLSVKWATCNIGAESPEGYGSYFAWGETEPKSNYSWSTYKHCNNGSSSILTKYNVGSSWGTVDNITTLELEDDAARVNLGGSWRMPTSAEQDELIEKCTWTWTTLNGVKGYRVVSKSNGNSIFLPAAGSRDGTSVYDAGSIGFYWSSSLGSGYPAVAYYLGFASDGVYWSIAARYTGYTVRAVCP